MTERNSKVIADAMQSKTEKFIQKLLKPMAINTTIVSRCTAVRVRK